MAVVEYMMWRIEGGTRRAVPDFIGSRGHWYSEVNKTFVGWIDDDRDYFVPDEIVTLTKTDFVDRLKALHAIRPLTKTPDGAIQTAMGTERVDMTEAEVITMAETWYDNFVAENSK